MGAGFSVSESMMMISEVKATVSGNGMQLMILQIGEYLDRSSVSTMELIIRISHLIMRETSLQAALVEAFVMSYERQVSHIFRCLIPDFREDWRIISIFLLDSMNLSVPITIVIRNRFYQTIKTIDNLPVSDDNDTDTARTSNIAVCRFEVYCGKVREIGNYYLIV